MSEGTEPVAKKKMSPFLLAWMAGVIEMKGKIRRIDNPLRKSAHLVLQVQSRHVKQIERLCDMTGVMVRITAAKTLETASRRGCTEHCPEPHVHVSPELPQMACWAITGAGAVVVLHNLLPYLCNTEGMTNWIDEVIAMLPKSGRGFAAVRNSANRLRALGWAIPDGLIPPEVETEPKPSVRAA